MLNLDGKLREMLGVMACFILRKYPAQLSQIKTEEIERNHLRGEGFRRSNANLRACVREDCSVSLAHNHRTLHVANSQNLRAALFRFAQRCDGVCRLARL